MFNKVSPGNNAPDSINVIIEIPAHSDPVKYEVDKDTGTLMVDRFMSTSMHYPCNYGYIPQTLSEDGDPVDVMVIAPFPLLSGCVIPCRVVGMLEMEDEKGPDHKLLAVPDSGLSQMYEHVQEAQDLPESLLNGIAHFFEHYKDLESNKWVKVAGWQDAKNAKQEIINSIERQHATATDA
jgi:inorganic pyrophosphatase